MNKLVKTKELYGSWPEYLAELFEGSEYPWEMLPKIKEYFASEKYIKCMEFIDKLRISVGNAAEVKGLHSGTH